MDENWRFTYPETEGTVAFNIQYLNVSRSTSWELVVWQNMVVVPRVSFLLNISNGHTANQRKM